MNRLQPLCPSCQRRLELPPEAVGRRARCPACEHVFLVPSPEESLSSGDSGPGSSPLADSGIVDQGLGPSDAPGGTGSSGLPPTAAPTNPFAAVADSVAPLGGRPGAPESLGGRPGAPEPVGATPGTQNPGTQNLGTQRLGTQRLGGPTPQNPYAPGAGDTPNSDLPFDLHRVSIDPVLTPTFELVQQRFGEVVAIGGLAWGANAFAQIVIGVLGGIAQSVDADFGEVVSGLMQMLGGLLGVYWSTGAINACLALLRDQPSPITRFFVSPLPALKLVLGGLLLGLVCVPVVAIGAVPLLIWPEGQGLILAMIVGGMIYLVLMILAMVLLWSWPILVVDGHRGIIRPMLVAVRISMANKGTSVLIVILGIVAGMAGVLICCVGGIITYPIKVLMTCIAYLLMTGKFVGSSIPGLRPSSVSSPSAAPPMY